MFHFIGDLPVELVGTNVFGYLSLKDIVLQERACCSKKSHHTFLNQIPYCPPVELPSNKHNNKSAVNWFVLKRCRVSSLTIQLAGDTPFLHMKNLQVEHIDIELHSLHSATTIENCKKILEVNIGNKVRNIDISGNPRSSESEVVETLSLCIGNVKKLIVRSFVNSLWLTADILSRWKLQEIHLLGPAISLTVHTCTELTSIKLDSDNIDDSAVLIIAQRCPNLEKLNVYSTAITAVSIIVLSEQGLPSQELIINPKIILNADIAMNCSHALSRIRSLYIDDPFPSFNVPYMTGLITLQFESTNYIDVTLLIQHCHKLQSISLDCDLCSVQDILPLCHANPLLQELYIHDRCGMVDHILIELINNCQNLHSLWLSYETDITDIGILALSEHCPQLQEFLIRKSIQVTEAAVLQLLQCCRKLTRLEVSSSSLSEETWTQLDRNTQKRVSRW